MRFQYEIPVSHILFINQALIYPLLCSCSLLELLNDLLLLLFQRAPNQQQVSQVEYLRHRSNLLPHYCLRYCLLHLQYVLILLNINRLIHIRNSHQNRLLLLIPDRLETDLHNNRCLLTPHSILIVLAGSALWLLDLKEQASRFILIDQHEIAQAENLLLLI